MSQDLFLDFLDEPAESARRRQRGVYTSHTFELPAGGEPRRTVTVLLLDVRYHKTPYCTWPVRLTCRGDEYDFLGEEQWAWLEATLRTSSSDVNVIVSGVQILPEHRFLGENWSRFPHARARLLNTILNSGARGILLASGDVHFAEISRAVCKPVPAPGAATPQRELVEVTSSGMTHSWGALSLPARLVFHLFMAISPYRSERAR